MTDFKPEVVKPNLPPGFRRVRLNLNNQQNQFNHSNQTNPRENIYDEPCAFDINQQQNQVPPPLPSSQPPAISSSYIQQINEQQNAPTAQPFWSLPSQEQEQLQRHLQQHLSRSPTPTFGENLVNAENIQKVITDKEPPANAEFLYETDAFKFYTIPAKGARKVMSIKQQTNTNNKVRGVGPTNENGIPLTLRTGVNHRHGSEWYKTMFKNMHITDKPKWMYEEPIKVKKTKKPKKEKLLPNETYIYDNQPSIQSQYLENERRKKELQKEVQRENPYICDDTATKYIMKKKKSSKCKSPVSRKTYAMIQKGEDIPLSGLNRPAPKFKNKVEFCEEKEQTMISRSPTPVCLTYPASDYVPERPPTPQYISQQQYNQTTTTINSYNQYNNQMTIRPSDKEIYDTRPTYLSTKNKANIKTDFTTIDEWQRKTTDDFNQLYSSLEKNFELKRLRETGKLVSPVPPSESRRDTSHRTAKELYLEQAKSPKPPSRRYYVEPSQPSQPLSANDLFNEDLYKANKINATGSSTRNWLDSSNKLNRYNSSQDLHYLNPNNNNYDFNNNLLTQPSSVDYESTKRTIHQHNSLDNLNSLNTCVNRTSDYQPVHNYNYKIFAQPTTTRTYSESTYYDTANVSQPVVERLESKTANTFQLQKQTSLLDIEKQLNEQLGDLLRSTSSFDDRKEKTPNDFSDSPSFNRNLNMHKTAINITKPAPPSMRHQINLELEKSVNTVDTSTTQAIDSNRATNNEKFDETRQIEQRNINELTNRQVDEEIGQTQVKQIPFNFKQFQDVNNISFQTNEEDVDSYDKLIRKIEQDAILQDEEIGMY